ncbi:hypothetical protein HDV57DRAFT_488157 [Trichoderma longibrachiatum]
MSPPTRIAVTGKIDNWSHQALTRWFKQNLGITVYDGKRSEEIDDWTLLVVGRDPKSELLRQAKSRDIPVVDQPWIQRVRKDKKLIDVNDYLHTSPRPDAEEGGSAGHSRPRQDETQDQGDDNANNEQRDSNNQDKSKGKGKAMVGAALQQPSPGSSRDPTPAARAKQWFPGWGSKAVMERTSSSDVDMPSPSSRGESRDNNGSDVSMVEESEDDEDDESEYQSDVEDGVAPDGQDGVQPNGENGVQPNGENGVQPGVQPNGENGVQPGVQPNGENGVQPGVQPDDAAGIEPDENNQSDLAQRYRDVVAGRRMLEDAEVHYIIDNIYPSEYKDWLQKEDIRIIRLSFHPADAHKPEEQRRKNYPMVVDFIIRHFFVVHDPLTAQEHFFKDQYLIPTKDDPTFKTKFVNAQGNWRVSSKVDEIRELKLQFKDINWCGFAYDGRTCYATGVLPEKESYSVWTRSDLKSVFKGFDKRVDAERAKFDHLSLADSRKEKASCDVEIVKKGGNRVMSFREFATMEASM